MMVSTVTRLRSGVTRRANAGAGSYAVTQLRDPLYMYVHTCGRVRVCVHVCVRNACVTA